MAHIIHQFFTHQALALRAGRMAQLAHAYSTPLYVLLPRREDHVFCLADSQAVRRFFSLKFAGLEAAGIDYLRASVGDIRFDGDDRARASVEWHYMDHDGRRAARSRATYFLSRRPEGVHADMIEFEALAFPAIADWLAEAARAEAPAPLQ